MAGDVRERILEGAARAVARHGVARFGMQDVSGSAAVSRGTLYKHFRSRRELLGMLALHEGRRFQDEVADAVRGATGEKRLLVALRHASRHAREHPILRRILETDPAFVLVALREQFPVIRDTIQALFAPLLADTALARTRIATVEQLVDWLTRLMISAFLFPDPAPERMAQSLTAVYRMLTTPEPARAAGRKQKVRRKSP